MEGDLLEMAGAKEGKANCRFRLVARWDWTVILGKIGAGGCCSCCTEARLVSSEVPQGKYFVRYGVRSDEVRTLK